MAVEETGPGTPDSEWATEQGDDINSTASGHQGACQMPLMPLRAISAPTRRPSCQTLAALTAVFEAELVIGRALILQQSFAL